MTISTFQVAKTLGERDMEFLNQYCRVHGARPDDNFAKDRYNRNTFAEICECLFRRDPDPIALNDWRISEQEWRDGLWAAMQEKLRDFQKLGIEVNFENNEKYQLKHVKKFCDKYSQNYSDNLALSYYTYYDLDEIYRIWLEGESKLEVMESWGISEEAWSYGTKAAIDEKLDDLARSGVSVEFKKKAQ
jgi:hypothetical protein